MLATLGDLIEDVVVRLDGPVRVATDTPSIITRRRGGSAANVAATAASLGVPVRFLGQVGTDPIGSALIAELADAGVDTQFVRRRGSTGTIVVLVDADGERSMLTDRRTCADLAEPEQEWLDGVTALHVPLYSLIGGATATTAATLIGWARDRRIPVSVDLSSTALMEEAGVDVTRRLVQQLQPDVVFANGDEATTFGISGSAGDTGLDAITVVKDGPRSAVLRVPASRSSSREARSQLLAIPAIEIAGVDDTTGAGDAFAAGFLSTRDWQNDPIEACIHGHRAAHRLLTSSRH